MIKTNLQIYLRKSGIVKPSKEICEKYSKFLSFTSSVLLCFVEL